MYTIGVTGGIGAGKSRVLDYLRTRWGAEIIRLDDISRGLLSCGTPEYKKTCELFGPDYIRDDGTLDRGKIAARIFADEKMRDLLDGIIHPAVKTESVRLKEEAEKAGCRLFVIEAALLIEEHYDAICNELWYIYAGDTTRYSRLTLSRGYDGQRIRDTMARQLTDEEFRANTDYTVDNSGSFEETMKAVDCRIRKILEAGN